MQTFILNRNRLTTTKALYEWLWYEGGLHPMIIDIASTYKPLLSWYATHDVNVYFVHENIGPHGFWAKGLRARLAGDRPYILTDSDVYPADYCPSDIIVAMEETLKAHPECVCVGPSLRIDNLPSNELTTRVIQWERRFWEHEVEDGCGYWAEIDTTFAIHRSDPVCRLDRSIRLGYPYHFEHRPWYVTELDAEERYYRSHVDPSYTWWSKE